MRLWTRRVEGLAPRHAREVGADCESIEEMSLERVGEPHIRHVDGRLWEMRLKGRSGISRALYVTATGQRVVIVFVKKTEKTSRREIEVALARAKVVD